MTDEELKLLNEAVLIHRNRFTSATVAPDIQKLEDVPSFLTMTKAMAWGLITCAGYSELQHIDADHPFVIDAAHLFGHTESVLYSGIHIGLILAELKARKNV